MRVEPYERSRHDELIRRWCTQRGVGAGILDILPSHGFIVPNLAAGFLYQTDSRMALIEGIVSNPEAAESDRDVALDCVFGALFELATELGFGVVWGFTPRPEVVARGKRLGFSVDEKRTYTFGARRLG